MSELSQIAMRMGVSLWAVVLEAAPWFAFGLLIAAVLKVWVPDRVLVRWLGGKGFGSIFRAAVIGTPLPLCSCGVLPAAMALRRGGASRGATVSFLVATPENGVDSILVSYAMLGPVMTVVRPIAAIFSACLAGVLAELAPAPAKRVSLSVMNAPNANAATDSCCATGSCDASPAPAAWPVRMFRAAADIMDDLAAWMAVGLIAAAAMNAFVPPETIGRWGSGLPAMLAILVIAVPMYICATSSTPIAAALILAGVSPGTALVFMLAGPATNFSAIAVLRKELGTRTVAAYLLGICVGAVSMGLLTDYLIAKLKWNVVAQVSHAPEWIPAWFAATAAVLLVLFAIRPLRRGLTGLRFGREKPAAAH